MKGNFSVRIILIIQMSIFIQLLKYKNNTDKSTQNISNKTGLAHSSQGIENKNITKSKKYYGLEMHHTNILGLILFEIKSVSPNQIEKQIQDIIYIQTQTEIIYKYLLSNFVTVYQITKKQTRKLCKNYVQLKIKISLSSTRNIAIIVDFKFTSIKYSPQTYHQKYTRVKKKSKIKNNYKDKFTQIYNFFNNYKSKSIFVLNFTILLQMQLPLFLTWPLLKECQKITTVCLTLVLLYTMVQQQMQIQVLQEIIYKQNILTLTQLKKQGSTETLMYYFLKFIYTKKLEYSCKIHQNIFITITTVKQSLLNKFNNVLVLFLQPLPKKATRIENRRPYPNFFEKIFKFQIPFSSFSKLSDTPTIN
eukprot:TRINITY_DN8645_c0_g1_i8.p1 TRINITY_DN8645_c0_g1~~TRINITY_DN8645_c0_g1_i8.p1  ORF type:complete len:362 (+),score=-17.03 TRINITY_DN8645_c0_g1_i8:1473-2558(+)